MQASHTASRCMQKIHQPQVVCREEHVGGAHPIVCREEHVGGAHPKKIKKENPEPMNSARGCIVSLQKEFLFLGNVSNKIYLANFSKDLFSFPLWPETLWPPTLAV